MSTSTAILSAPQKVFLKNYIITKYVPILTATYTYKTYSRRDDLQQQLSMNVPNNPEEWISHDTEIMLGW